MSIASTLLPNDDYKMSKVLTYYSVGHIYINTDHNSGPPKLLVKRVDLLPRGPVIQSVDAVLVARYTEQRELL